MKLVICVSILLFLLPIWAHAAGLGSQLSGMILLDVENHGEAWYVNPENDLRYYLGRPADAFKIMRQLGLGIKEVDFQRIAQAGMPVPGDVTLAKKLAGRIVIEVEKNGEAWYINPKDLKKYYLGRPDDAFKIMRQLGLGISRENLAKIHKPGLSETINQYSGYSYEKVNVDSQSFAVDLVTIDLANPNLKIVTAAASPHPDPSVDKNKGPFAAESLAHYVFENNGFAGINGSYFCDAGGCGARNYYFFPIYDTDTGTMVNQDQLKYWTTGPVMAFDENNKFYYFKDSRDFQQAIDFTAIGGPEFTDTKVKLQAAIGNLPNIIENGMNALIDWQVNDQQKNTKSIMNALAYKDDKIYLVSMYNATVPELADLLKSMQVEYAINLDGGGSAAMIYNGEYMVGPGRNVPNAIVFSE